MRIINIVLDYIGRFQLIQSFLQNLWIVLPLGWFATTGVAGYMTHAPWMWILVAMAASAAFICVAVLAATALHMMNDPEHKLKFVGVTLGFDFVQSKTNSTQKRISKANIFAIIKNDANFPIYAYVEMADTCLEGKYPPRTKYPKPASMIGAGATIFMSDEVIQMENRECGNLNGKATFVIRYGRKGKEKYELRVNGNVIAPMDRKGVVTQATLFNHLPESIVIDHQP